MHSIDCLDCLQLLNLLTWKKKRARSTQGWVGGWVCELSKQEKCSSVPTPYPGKSYVLRWCPVLSRFPPRIQRSNENTRKYRAVNNLLTVELLSLSVCFRFVFEELCNGYLLVMCALHTAAQGKFKLTNQDSAGAGKIYCPHVNVSRKALKSGNFSHWRWHQTFTKGDLQSPKPYHIGLASKMVASLASPGEDYSCLILNKICRSSSNLIKPEFSS